MTAPYGSILAQDVDFENVRHAIGVETFEIPDALIGEPENLGAAESIVMRRVPDWYLILHMASATAPVLAAQANAGSTLLAATYFVVLVSKAGARAAAPDMSTETSQAIVAGQQLSITAPSNQLGITSYDVYVGTSAGAEYFQGTVSPGASFALTSFTIQTSPISQAGRDGIHLKSAAIAMTCAQLCSRFVRRLPRRVQTGNYREELDVDWRAEQMAWERRGHYYIGLVSTVNFVPVAGLDLAQPLSGPTEPDYIHGTNRNAIPAENDQD